MYRMDSARKQRALDVTFDYADSLLKLAGNLADNTPLSGAIAIARDSFEAVKLAKSNCDDAGTLARRTYELVVPVVRAVGSRSEAELGRALLEELDALQELLIRIRDAMYAITGKSRLMAVVHRQKHKDLIKELTEELDYGYRRFMVSGLINLHQEVRQLGIDENRLLATDTSKSACGFPSKPLHFVSRQDLVKTAVSVLTDSPQPQLAIIGVGGIGKTSLAVAAAHEPACMDVFEDRRYFIPCDALSSASSVVSVLLQVLSRAPVPPKGDPWLLLDRALGSAGKILVILDNFETPWTIKKQRVELVKLLTKLAAYPGISLVVTLRSDVAPARADVVWTVLAPPVIPLDAARDLFLTINPDTEAHEHESLDTILREIDGLPLAVKLLAETKKQQSCLSLLRRWRDTKTALIRAEHDSGDRSTSLDVSISLSLHSIYITQVPHAQTLLATICHLPAGVIGGRERLHQMQLGLADLDRALDALLGTALIDQTPQGNIHVLSPIRLYILGLRMPDLAPELERYYSEQLIARYGQRTEHKSRFEVLFTMLADADNIAALFAGALRNNPTQRLILAIIAFVEVQKHVWPSTDMFEYILERPDTIPWPPLRALCTFCLGRIQIMRACLHEGLITIANARDQLLACGDTLHAAQCLHRLADIHYGQGLYSQAKTELGIAQAEYISAGDKEGPALCLLSLGDIHRLQSEYAAAKDRIRDAGIQFQAIGHSLGRAECLRCLGNMYRLQRRYKEAAAKLQEAQRLFVFMGYKHGIAQCLYVLGDIDRMKGLHDEAQAKASVAQNMFHRKGDRRGVAQCLWVVGENHLMQGQLAEAEEVLQHAHGLFRSIDDGPGIARCLYGLGEIRILRHHYQDAEKLLHAAHSRFSSMGETLGSAESLKSLGKCHIDQGMFDIGMHELQEAQTQMASIGHMHGVAQCLSVQASAFESRKMYAEAETALTAAQISFGLFGDDREEAQCHARLDDIRRRQTEPEAAAEEVSDATDSFALMDTVATNQSAFEDQQAPSARNELHK